MELSLLKECYTLAAEYEPVSAARDILHSRGRKIAVTEEQAPSSNNAGSMVSDQTVMSEALRGGSGYGRLELRRSSSRMSFCGDREFLLAILELNDGRGEYARIHALEHISAALTYSPNDPRYIALAEILQQYGK